ncbi:LuxR C-terminal-related transcriptional regulator [Priestia aryabhattai]|uniref:LuxR C-terminal-related transcriptional regulator n=1 Tax=Priestia aryabhattai TaxID=412384 RepID=UPI002E1E7537|nr:LuxR C-terminal-related transcriptional regulator [Priestia aryabhattai]MED3918614.1 LuxR C-terminal-related transcriptional regulator [Priestia aryabhattai]
MNQTEKLLMGIENVLSIAAELVDEVSRLKDVEEECRILKEKLFLKQFTLAEKEVFALALDGHSISEMQSILYKEEDTIKTQRRSILQKLNASSMSEAVQQFKNIS